jgi:Recombinase zinc beta ribbon domain/Recombinase
VAAGGERLGNPHWSSNGVATLLRNPAYLGQARSGKVVKEGAHEAIVTRAEFDTAQGTRTLLAPAVESLAAQALLGGLIRCAGCGHTLKISGSLDKRTGKRYPTYSCTGRYAKGLCPRRATIRASAVDEYVETAVLAALRADGGPLAQAVQASEQIDEAARVVANAEHELDCFVTNPKLLTLLGEDRFGHGVEARQRALDEARATLATIRQN